MGLERDQTGRRVGIQGMSGEGSSRQESGGPGQVWRGIKQAGEWGSRAGLERDQAGRRVGVQGRSGLGVYRGIGIEQVATGSKRVFHNQTLSCQCLHRASSTMDRSHQGADAP